MILKSIFLGIKKSAEEIFESSIADALKYLRIENIGEFTIIMGKCGETSDGQVIMTT
ncbi:MAG: hypothetical protein Ct9H90mP18_04150 [Gammaproteobacteria bacterium]|nr:MAG: hypothetical protein Ct9H90mP18_04150 [Gammaproteobacteria bacterium]